jgi:hypothetical protein
MKQTKINKRAKTPCEVAPIQPSMDPRDAEVVRAKAVGRSASGLEAARARFRVA